MAEVTAQGGLSYLGKLEVDLLIFALGVLKDDALEITGFFSSRHLSYVKGIDVSDCFADSALDLCVFSVLSFAAFVGCNVA
jgi:hypothetical protein